MSTKNPNLRQQTSIALLAGCLLVSAAHAQDTPAIQAVGDAPVTAAPVTAAPAVADAPVPQKVAAPLPLPRAATLELSFRDIPVKDLLNLLGTQFGLNLAVNGEIDGVIGSINLTNQTPEEALQTVVEVAGNLSVNRMSNGNYIVKKALPGEATRMVSQVPGGVAPGNFAGAPGFPQSITPTPDFLNGFGTTPINNSAGIGSALPPLGQAPAYAPIPELANLNQNRERNQGSRYVRLKNVKPSMMAYWLDPAHNAMPQALQSSINNERFYGESPIAREATEGMGLQDSGAGFGGFGGSAPLNNSPYVSPYVRNSSSSQVRPTVRTNSQFGGGNQGGNNRGGNQGGGGGGGRGGGSFDLPGDIEQLVSIDPQNVLLVAGGSEEDLRRLQEIIDILDQPLRQVEIEAQFVDLQTNDARAFGIDFSTSRGNFDAATTGLASAPVPGAFQIGFVRGNFQARLNALIASNRAKLITAPRVTAINNLTARLQSTERRPLILTSVSQNIGGQQAQQQRLLFVNTTVGLVVTPTINNDDTITVFMNPEVSTQGGSTGLGNVTQRTVETVANVKDGDTIVLGGLKRLTAERQNYEVPILSKIPIIGGLFRSSTVTETESELIIFLTARIVRRAGADINVPGT